MDFTTKTIAIWIFAAVILILLLVRCINCAIESERIRKTVGDKKLRILAVLNFLHKGGCNASELKKEAAQKLTDAGYELTEEMIGNILQEMISDGLIVSDNNEYIQTDYGCSILVKAGGDYLSMY